MPFKFSRSIRQSFPTSAVQTVFALPKGVPYGGNLPTHLLMLMTPDTRRVAHLSRQKYKRGCPIFRCLLRKVGITDLFPKGIWIHLLLRVSWQPTPFAKDAKEWGSQFFRIEGWGHPHQLTPLKPKPA